MMGIHPLSRSIAHKAFQIILVENKLEFRQIAESAVVD
jgi:hypothetical protein